MSTKTKLKWGEKYLKEKGYFIEGEPRVVRLMPWSKVYCFKTNHGQIYLKSMAREFSFEPILLNFLIENSFKKIPEVIAINQQKHCFLMEEAGNPLRDSLKENFSLEIIGNVLKAYADIQLEAVDYVDLFLKLGIKDRRLKNLPSLYQRFLLKKDFLKDYGMEESEIKELKSLALNSDLYVMSC